ncbi:hypothetical protein DPEC_G00248850 [Dallia pectoralis]|uniref:Uncharacterized protein n=1 Tax=Dallia pectoralis TaxID=75939 RepID=A0ACC2FST6_DALPE|nr:hypothetical protein DPEC_G00248850 [Dallia pectoralis]
MNFPQHLINWTNLCYQNISSRVLVNNILTDPFPIRSGVRQGCPLAPLLYVIYLEPFLERIRTSPGIPGYQLPGAGGERLRVMAYMDDITIVGTDSRSITTATKAVDDYCAATGALVNRETIKLLGITFQRDGGGSTSWAETICHVQRKICEWSARSLTMTGKTLILKAIVLPILLYLGRVFPPDKAASKKIERLMFTFVWGSQMEQLQRSTLYKMVENRGKGVPDILNIIRAQQLSNLVKTFNKPDRKASFFERHYATPILRTLGMGTIDHTVSYSWDPPKVYKAIRDFAFGSGLSTAGLASWKYKDIMGHIRSKDTVAPLRDSSTVAPQQVWLNVNHHCLTNRQKDISWMAVHGCLPTGEFMYRRHIALTVSCPHGCNTVENTYHVLAECSVARRVWALFVPSVSHNRLLTLPRLTTENILNGPPGGCTTTELRQQWRIIGVVKQVLWETRNIMVFNKTTVDPTTLRRRITILLRDHAITDFHKDPVTARAAWGGTLAYRHHQQHQNGRWSGLLTGEFHLTAGLLRLSFPTPQHHHPSTQKRHLQGQHQVQILPPSAGPAPEGAVTTLSTTEEETLRREKSKYQTDSYILLHNISSYHFPGTMADNTFPLYKVDAIVTFFRTEVLTGQEAKQFTKNDISPSPKAESVQRLYMRVLQLLFRFRPECHYVVPFSENIQFPDLHERSTAVISVYLRMRQFLPICYVYDFSLNDLLSPKMKRTMTILSGIMNFLHFRKQRLDMIVGHQERFREDMDRLQAYSQGSKDAQKKIDKLTTIPAEQQAEAKELDAALSDLQARTMQQYQKVNVINENIAEWKTEIAERSQKLTKLKVDVASQKEDIGKLKSQIVESPEEMKIEMEKMKDNVRTIKEAIKQADERLVELQGNVHGVTHSEAEIQLMFQLLQDLETSINKTKLHQEEVQELVCSYEKQQKDLKKLGVEEVQLRRALALKMDKESKQQIRRQKKKEMKEQHIQEVLGQCDNVHQKREQIADQIQEIDRETQHFRNQINNLRDACSRETEKAQDLFDHLLAALEEFHKRIQKNQAVEG